MQPDSRSPEHILDEIYETAQRLMAGRARERAHRASTIWAKGDNPPAHEDPELENLDVRNNHRLRSRFDDLTREFLARLDDF